MQRKRIILTLTTFIMITSLFLVGCNKDKNIEVRPIEKENLTETLEIEEIKTTEMPNQENIEEKEIVFKTDTFTTGYVLFPIEEKGEFGDYTAVELNKCFQDKNSLTSFLDEFISFEKNDLSIDEQSIILEKFTKYDEVYFEKNNLYLISSMNSTPLLDLQTINKTFLED